MKENLKVILYQPEIPQNTGNIARTCGLVGADLGLVRPLGFSTSDSKLKRAGLYYWDKVHIFYIDDLEDYLSQITAPFYFFSSKASKRHTEVPYNFSTHLIFGSETRGLPDYFHEKWSDKMIKIPMIVKPGIEGCLNLSNAASIAVYEAWRQLNFFNA